MQSYYARNYSAYIDFEYYCWDAYVGTDATPVSYFSFRSAFGGELLKRQLTQKKAKGNYY